MNNARDTIIAPKLHVSSIAGAGGWQPIETAPKGGGAEMVTDPGWVEPPRVLLFCEDCTQVVAMWDWYYAEGGRGCTDGCAWIEPTSSGQVNMSYGEPTHWMPLPPPPAA